MTRIMLILLLCGSTVQNVYAQAQGYPDRPVRLIVALAAGGSSDTVGRILANKLTDELHQQFVIDNRPGAGGSVGGEIAARAPADGYTLFFAANGTIAIAPNMMKLSFNVQKDLTPVAMVGSSPFVMMIHPSIQAHSVQELLALARTKPGKLTYGSSGQGSTGHLAWALLNMDTKTSMTHVPYRGSGPALIAIVGGEIDTVMFGASAALPYIRRQQLRALGVTSPKRLSLLPDVPAIAETVPGYDVSSWYAMLATAGTPAAIITRLNKATVKTMNSPEVKETLNVAGVDPTSLTPEQLGKQIKEETERWNKVVKALGIKGEQ